MTDILELYGSYDWDVLKETLQKFKLDHQGWVKDISVGNYMGFKTIFINRTPWYTKHKQDRIKKLVLLGNELVMNGIQIRFVGLRDKEFVPMKWDGKWPKPV